jgi:hypothetical protein
MEHRSIGERAAGAWVGALFGAFLGVGLMVGAYVLDPGSGNQFSVLVATIVYCALFTFAFGEQLADVVATFTRLVGVLVSIGAQTEVVDPDSSWVRAGCTFLLFSVPLAIIIYVVAK